MEVVRTNPWRSVETSRGERDSSSAYEVLRDFRRGHGRRCPSDYCRNLHTTYSVVTAVLPPATVQHARNVDESLAEVRKHGCDFVWQQSPKDEKSISFVRCTS